MEHRKAFYDQARWRRARARRLRHDEYQCQECKRFGLTTQATTVHHIYPLESHWNLRLDSRNLISLCAKCHGKMHKRITDEITEAGIRWQNKIRKLFGTNPPSN